MRLSDPGAGRLSLSRRAGFERNPVVLEVADDVESYAFCEQELSRSRITWTIIDRGRRTPNVVVGSAKNNERRWTCIETYLCFASERHTGLTRTPCVVLYVPVPQSFACLTIAEMIVRSSNG